MTTKLKSNGSDVLRVLGVAIFALALAACGGSSTSSEGDGLPDTGGVSNPDNIDVNGDNILDTEDDFNGDGVVDNDDVVAFMAANPTTPPVTVTDPNALEGNILPDCSEVDCVSANSIWSDNTLITQNRSPVSTYSMGIQRILFCLNIGTSADKTIDVYADGIYGGDTAMDVETYQNLEENAGLVADGAVGRDTWDSLQRDISFLIASGDGLNDLWGVTSVRPGCENLAQFAELKAEPRNWQLVAEPGGSTYVPFSSNSADLP